MAAQSSVASELLYNSKPGAAPAAVVRVNTPPFNKDNFSRGNETIMINIPSGKRGQYLDPSMSYLKFTLEIGLKQGQALGTWSTVDQNFGDGIPLLALDGGAHSFFNFLEVYHGSNQLEQIREYNALYQLLMDQGEDPDGYTEGRAVCEGTTKNNNFQYNGRKSHREGVVVSDAVLPDPQTGTYHTVPQNYAGPFYMRNNFKVFTGAFTNNENHAVLKHAYADAGVYIEPYIDLAGQSGEIATIMHNKTATNHSQGHVLGVVQGPVTGNRRLTRKFTFCMPIMSGVLGTGMPKYVPVGILNSDLRLELGIAPWEQAFKCVGLAFNNDVLVDVDARWQGGSRRVDEFYDVNITQVEYVADYVELAADVQLAVEAQHSGSYYMSYDSYSNFATSLPAGSSNYSQLIGAKVSSMKTIFSIFRDQHTMNSLRGSQVTSRLNPFSLMVPRPEFVNSRRDLSDTQYSGGVGWYYAIGATHYPPTPVRSDPESFYEGLKARHNLLMRHASGLITPRDYSISARVDSRDASGSGRSDMALAPEEWFQAAMQGGTFFLGMNFESQAHRSDYSNSGVSTLAQSMYLMCRFPNAYLDFGGEVWINTGRINAEGSVMKKDKVAIVGDETAKEILLMVNKYAYPGAIVPTSQLPALSAGALDTATQTLHKKVNYSTQQTAMIVDHFVHYDGFMVVEMGEVKTRW